MNYEESVRYLLNLPRKKGEDKFLDFKNQIEKNLSFSLSVKKPYFIHVAGTNGKGSVVGYLQTLLIGQGYKVGTYQSPHVYDIRERISINGQALSKDRFAYFVEENINKYGCWSQYLIGMALSCFFKEECEFIIWETGIGGRFDPTNIIEHSTCCLTSIGLNHTHLLGTTLSDIAWQKIGILKPKSAITLGYMPQEVISLVEKEIVKANAKAWWLGKEIQLDNDIIHYPTRTYVDLVPQPGPKQMENMTLALGTLEIKNWIKDPLLVRSSLKHVHLKGRWEKKVIDGVKCIFDGGHNKEAALSIINYLKKLNDRWIILGSTSIEHDPQDFFDPFVTEVNQLFWVDLKERAWVGKVPAYFKERFNDMSQAINYTIQKAKEKKCNVLILGSFYLIGEIKKHLNDQE